jgi:hypothetical protein
MGSMKSILESIEPVFVKLFSRDTLSIVSAVILRNTSNEV